LAGAVQALAKNNPHAKIAMVYSDDPFSKAVLAAAKAQATKAGPTVVMDEVLRAVDHDSRPDRQQDHLVERRCVSSAAAIIRMALRWPARCTIRRRI